MSIHTDKRTQISILDFMPTFKTFSWIHKQAIITNNPCMRNSCKSLMSSIRNGLRPNTKMARERIAKFVKCLTVDFAHYWVTGCPND